MDFALTDDQLALQQAARRYLTDRYPITRIAELADADEHDRDGWAELDRQGWLDPELGLVELALLAEEGGRALHPAPWWVTVGQALPAYRAAGVELPGPATFADGSSSVRAVSDGDAWRLDGRIGRVVDAQQAQEIVVAASTGDGPALFGVRAQEPGASISPVAGLDPLRTVAELELDRASARLLVAGPAAVAVLAGLHARAAVLLSCEAVGVADRVLQLAVDYAQARVQFDRPIGSYQAVAHRLADSYADVQLARSLAYRAACLQADGSEQTGVAIAAAVHGCTGAAVAVCESAIQVCGGIGVTWEYPLHRWYRRALWLQARQAAGPDPLEQIADHLLTAARAAAG